MDRIEGWFGWVERYLEYFDSDRVIFAFVAAWAVAGAVWIVLDWLANPNRGGFKPTRDLRVRGFQARRAQRRLKNAEDDAAVRATLRDAYGVSSLRTVWSRSREARALEADDLLVRELPASARPRLRRKVFARLAEVLSGDDPPAGDPLLATLDADPTDTAEPAAPIRIQGRWRLGDDPLTANSDGKPPSTAVLCRRVWKNHALHPMWGADNQARMSSGKVPVRVHPVHGEQKAFVNLMSVHPCWPETAVDPFERAGADRALLPAPAETASRRGSSSGPSSHERQDKHATADDEVAHADGPNHEELRLPDMDGAGGP